MLGRFQRIHMVGIGGIGMSSIAEVLLTRGFQVSGSDLATSDVTERLESLGAKVYKGHDAAQVGDAQLVVYSSAVKPDRNPETKEATRLRIPLIPRSVMLGELMRMKFGIGIAGTHGKTTTTSMAGLVVESGGFDPTIIVGGKVSVFGSNAVTGEGDVILVEADEYDRTFLRLTPSLAVITNIEEEHLDIYRDLDDLLEAFVQFANSVPFFGAAILCLDDANVQRIVGRIDRRVVTYGTSRQADVRADRVRQDGLSMVFDVVHRGKRLGEARVNQPGMHNVQNALAAITVGLELEIDFEGIVRGLDRFSGVQRRLHVLGEARGVLVVDDYAHHPTEVVATLDAAVNSWPDRRIVAAFQPHLYSRTADFKEGFARAFFNADVLVLTEIYGARESEEQEISGQTVADLAEQFGHRSVHYIEDKKALATGINELVREGDVVITMGAGDIWRSSRELLAMLEEGA
ncbi:MAG: UDP-N-acetylmuramate--L-alanine ligase [Rhodothermales bacterium]|nr:UDP-N-acetylmuramate--L-alanine ligase [Rhodothermales bacterium]MBO6778881.1 UDP-N-acetylmuramate--L-alanine ligase [Rhodothermales bacterium]